MASSLARVARLSSSSYSYSSTPSFSCISNPFSLLSKNPGQGKLGLFKIGTRWVETSSPVHIPIFKTIFTMQKISGLCLHSSGRIIFSRGFLGIGAASYVIFHPSNITYAMDDYSGDILEPSGDLKEDLNMVFAFARKYQFAFLLLISVVVGWRHPLTLAINTLLFLFCTRPDPLSLYVFIEQMRQRDMHREPSLRNSKYLYARNIQVDNYKLLCYGTVEIRHRKLHLIGMLGGWWIVHVSPI